MPSISLPLANLLFNVSSVALVAGAVLGIAGTIGTVWMGSVKERYGDERIAANEAETARAKESAALANERSLKLAVELEKERAARRDIEGRVQEQGAKVKELMPRRLSDAQKSLISAEGSKNKYNIEIGVDSAAPNLKSFAADLSDSFRSAGWAVINPQLFGLGSPPPSGVGILVNQPDRLTVEEAAVKYLFDKIQIRYDIQKKNSPQIPADIGGGVEVVITTPAR